jgi:hypothetical protein
MHSNALKIEPTGSSDYGPCECCGNFSRKVWGSINAGSKAVAVYYVHWTLTRVHDHGANFDLVLGPWGAGTSPADRAIVAVAFRIVDGGPSFMVIDAGSRPIAKDNQLASTALRRDQVIGTPLATEVFVMLDAIWTGDSRIVELTEKLT